MKICKSHFCHPAHYFNLIEIVLAMGVVAIGICAIIAMFPMGMNRSMSLSNDFYKVSVSKQILQYVRSVHENYRDCDLNDLMHRFNPAVLPTRCYDIRDSWDNGKSYGFKPTAENLWSRWTDIGDVYSSASRRTPSEFVALQGLRVRIKGDTDSNSDYQFSSNPTFGKDPLTQAPVHVPALTHASTYYTFLVQAPLRVFEEGEVTFTPQSVSDEFFAFAVLWQEPVQIPGKIGKTANTSSGRIRVCLELSWPANEDYQERQKYRCSIEM